MAKNKLSDLNDHLFAQIERLSDETMKPETMELEIKKAKVLVPLSDQVIQNAKLVYQVAKSLSEGELKHAPEQFGIEQNTNHGK